jgi:hypothetical protein
MDNRAVSKLNFIQKCQIYALVLCKVDHAEIAKHFGVTTRTVRNIELASTRTYPKVFADFVWRGSKSAFCQHYIIGELERVFPGIQYPNKGE